MSSDLSVLPLAGLPHRLFSARLCGWRFTRVDVQNQSVSRIHLSFSIFQLAHDLARESPYTRYQSSTHYLFSYLPLNPNLRPLIRII
jgi:hypothetical protein